MQSTNFLEELVAEWYEYNGHFVRRNVWYGNGPKGGRKGDMDVLAFNPKRKVFVHVEADGSSDKLSIVLKRLGNKFGTATSHYAQFVRGFKVEKAAVVTAVAAIKKNCKLPKNMNAVTIMTCSELTVKIIKVLKGKNPNNAVIPESWPLLRAIQLAIWTAKRKGKSKD